MNSRSLVFSVGNTTCKIAVMKDYAKEYLATFETRQILTGSEINESIVQLTEQYNIESVVICSVVREITEKLSHLVLIATGIDPVIVSASGVTWFKIHYHPVDALGADRLCDVIALREFYGYPSIAVDFGTATTINVLDEHGDFIGGSISPGITTSFEALSKRTSMLPKIHPKSPSNLVCQTTEEAIRSGILWYASYGISGMIKEIRKSFSGDVPAIITGGNAELFTPQPTLLLKHDNDLLFKGAIKYLLFGK